MLRCSLVLLAVLATFARADDVKYTTLIDDHVVNLDMKVSFTLKKDEGVLSDYNSGNPCPLEDAECQQPVFSYDDRATLNITFTAPTNLRRNTLKSLGDRTFGAPKKVLFKLCYAKPWTVDRKWRKAKDNISKDKRCKKKIGTVDIDQGYAEYTFPSDTPTAQWFITAYVKCETENTDGDTETCAVDTTGGITALASEGTAETSPLIYLKTDVIDSRTTGLYAACVILSLISVGLLIGFFVFEHLTQKNK